MGSADSWNKGEWREGNIDVRHITELTRFFQEKDGGLTVDGKLGPKTRRSLNGYFATNEPIPEDLPVVHVSEDGWLCGKDVRLMPIHPSWYYSELDTHDGEPEAIVAHYTDTDWGTGETMALQRVDPRKSSDRSASWHISIEYDGTIIQQAPLLVGCWHCRPTPEADEIIGCEPNRCSVGIELVGRGDRFPEEQVFSAARVWAAIVGKYDIEREMAMVQHSELDPDRRIDPGEVWMNNHSSRVLDWAYKQ